MLASAVGVLALAADQAVTSWVLTTVRTPRHLIGPLGLAVEYNTGVAFSALTGVGDWLVPVVIVVLVGMVGLAFTTHRRWHGVAYGLVLGGALGNLGDRVFRGGKVVDYVTLSHWPTFNVADACITAGVVILVVSQLLSTGHQPRRSR